MPSLISRPPRLPTSRRALAGAAAALLLLGGLLLQWPVAAAPPQPVSALIDAGDVALSVPLAWLAAPVPGAHHGDVVDIVGVRRGDTASIYPLASGARVVGVDDRALVLSIDEDDASQVALARANDLLIVPLLRPRR